MPAQLMEGCRDRAYCQTNVRRKGSGYKRDNRCLKGNAWSESHGWCRGIGMPHPGWPWFTTLGIQGRRTQMQLGPQRHGQ